MSPEPVRLGADAARLASARILPDTGAPLDAVVASVREQALEEGERRALAGQAGLLARAVDELHAFREGCVDELARGSVELAVEIARHLLRAEVEAGRYDLERLVRETLREASAERSRVTVHLNPDDLDSLQNQRVRFREGTRLEADVDVQRGDVHVETRLGIMVREMDAALASIRERLLEDVH